MKYLLYCLVSLCSLNAYCQDIEPSHGTFTQEEIDYKSCPFDKDADAVIFFDKALSNYDDERNLVTIRSIRFKILKQSGVGRGDIRLVYQSENEGEYIKDIKAYVMSFDDQGKQLITELEQNNIYKKKINNVFSAVSFALPNIKVGSIIEYTYTIVANNYGFLRDWYFQSSIPTLLSTYGLYILPDHVFAYTVKKSSYLPIDIKPEKTLGKISFTMKNVPGLRDEAFMGSEKDYLQRVVFQHASYNNHFGTNKTTDTWEQLTREFMDDRNFGAQLEKELSGTSELKTEWDRISDPYLKMKAIHEFVKNKMNWDDVGSLFTEDGIKAAWEKKKGHSADINLVLINLLKQNGYIVYPILISERSHGKVDTTYPYYHQFNKVAAYVLLNGRDYILDGVDYKTPTNIIPYEFLNTKGFIVDRKKWGFVTITDNNKKDRDIINYIANIDASGSMEGQTTLYHYDYSRLTMEDEFNKDQSKYRESYLKNYPGIKIDSFNINGFETDSLPLTEKFKLGASLNKSGNYYLLNYNMFTGYSKNPFISENRFSNIDFGCGHSCLVNATFILPANVDIESLPKSTALRMPDNSMSMMRVIEKQDNNIRVMLKVDITKTEYSADDYETVQGFFKQMTDLLNEPILLKTK